MSNVAKVMQQTELAKLIGEIGRSSVLLVGQIQVAAVACVAQSIVHRNATPAQQLFDAVGSSQRRDSLVSYFEAFGNLAWVKDEKTKKGSIAFFDVAKMCDKPALVWDEVTEQKCTETLWHQVKREPTPKSVFDVEAEVDALLTRLGKKQEQGADVKNSPLLNALVATVNRFCWQTHVHAKSWDVLCGNAVRQ